jgi:hypothetical protein
MIDLSPPSHQPMPEIASGRHMIEPLDAMILHGRAKKGREWRDQAETLHLLQNCIRAEAARADRAEGKVAFYEANTNLRPPEAEALQ